MLRQRVITAVILLVVVAGSLILGPWAFTALAAIAMGVCMWEWLRISKWDSMVSAVVGTALAVILYWVEVDSPACLSWFQDGNGLLCVTSAGTVIWAALTAVIFRRRRTGWSVPPVWSWLSAFILIPCAWFSLMYLYRTFGAVFMISVLSIVWVADIAAYFVGSFVKGPKMSEGISPKKTWSGAIGAFVLVWMISYVCYALWPAASLWTNAVIGVMNGFASGLVIFIAVLYSIAGDLYESALKRTAGVKDSSGLLPGHGGVYDRIDAQVAVLPLAVFILLYIQGI